MNIEHIVNNQFERIYSILLRIGDFYNPSLSNQVNSIELYSKKLSINAQTFMASDNEFDIGILSIYCNDYKNKIAYISTFGFDRLYNGKGFSKELLNYGLSYVERIGFSIVRLEVSKMNERAIAFYKKNKFYITETREDSYIMELLLKITKLSKNFEIQNKQIKVTRDSDNELKEHLYTIAKYFVKEFDYGPAYNYEYHTDDKNIGCLFVDGEIVFGGCGFSKLPIISEDIWCLEWVWLHPFFRHRGHFTYYWNIFIQEYPQMAIKAPISFEMKEFLNKQEDITIEGSLDRESGHVLVKRKEDNA